MEKLSERQITPLTSTDLEALREAARSADITVGLFSRALLRFGLDHLDDLADYLTEEKAQAAARTSAGARAAVSQRWTK